MSQEEWEVIYNEFKDFTPLTNKRWFMNKFETKFIDKNKAEELLSLWAGKAYNSDDPVPYKKIRGDILIEAKLIIEDETPVLNQLIANTILINLCDSCKFKKVNGEMVITMEELEKSLREMFGGWWNFVKKWKSSALMI